GARRALVAVGVLQAGRPLVGEVVLVLGELPHGTGGDPVGFRRLPQDLPDPALRDLQILIRRLGDVALPRDHGRRYRGYGPALAVDVDVTLPQIVERGLQVELVLRQRGVGITQDAQYALRLCGRVAELRCRPGHELPGDGGVDARPVRRGGLLLQILGADLA